MPTNTQLEGKGLAAVANLITSGKAKNVIVMTGAGISTAAGIPDFRSPGTGLYSNLAKYKLPFPEAIFDISYFKKKPEPFYELAHELFPGKFLPTITHSFIHLLDDQGILLRCFTQNIDTLERAAGVPGNRLVEAHGSFASSRCISCKEPVDSDWVKAHIDDRMIPKCELCTGLIKPDITFFGESLPERFFQQISDFRKCDLLIVIGTSLQVQPFASLIDEVPRTCPRVLINMEVAGTAGRYGGGFDFAKDSDFDGQYTRKRDILYQGDCNAAIEELSKALGWTDKLNKLHEITSDRLRTQWNMPPSATKTKPTLETAIPLTEEEEKVMEEIRKLPTTPTASPARNPFESKAARKAAETAAAIGKAANNGKTHSDLDDEEQLQNLPSPPHNDNKVVIQVYKAESKPGDKFRAYDINIADDDEEFERLAAEVKKVTLNEKVEIESSDDKVDKADTSKKSSL